MPDPPSSPDHIPIADRLRRLRWAIADRIGRALLGGRLEALATETAEREATRRAAEERLARRIDAVTARIDAVGAELAAAETRLAAACEATLEAIAPVEARVRAVEAEAPGVRLALAGVDAAVADLRTVSRDHREMLWGHARSLEWLAGRHTPALTAPPDRGLVSVVMPVWNRAHTLAAAIASVRAQTYRQWELLLVDDGSTDASVAVARQAADGDQRVHILPGPHGGPASARNRGLAAARGDLVAYLDSDNTWEPGYLAAVVAALTDDTAECVYLAQLVDDRRRDDAFVRAEPFDRARLERANFIDLNVFAHRRALVDRLGAFDPTLTRLSDWDLVLRYTAERAPARVDAVGGRYALGRPDQVSARESFHVNRYRIRRKLERPIAGPLRVLYALGRHPQPTECDVRVELRYLWRRGVEVVVWRQEPPAVASPSEVPVSNGALADAIATVQPHVLHVPRLDHATAMCEVAGAAGLPVTVRGHGVELDPPRVAALDADPAVHAAFIVPPLAADAIGKVRAVPLAFDGDRYRPAARKDPRLVVRTAAGIPNADLAAFVRIAARCPDHRFVLAAAPAPDVDEVIAYNRACGGPVDVRVDLQHEATAALLAEAGIYLHTRTAAAPYAMPLALAEAMATGACVVAQRGVGTAAWVGMAGCLYETEDEAAALVRATLDWDDLRWADVRLAAVERAYGCFADDVALEPMLAEWLRLRDASLQRAGTERVEPA